MRKVLTFSMVVLSLSALSGCAVPGMVAHIAKSVQGGNQGSGQAAAQPAPPQPQPQADPYEAPPPVAAGQESIQTESLPPPK